MLTTECDLKSEQTFHTKEKEEVCSKNVLDIAFAFLL